MSVKPQRARRQIHFDVVAQQAIVRERLDRCEVAVRNAVRSLESPDVVRHGAQARAQVDDFPFPRTHVAALAVHEVSMGHHHRSRGHSANDRGESLSRLAFSRDVTAQCPKRDRYRREVCKIMRRSTDVSLEQNRNGMAWWYREYAKAQREEDRVVKTPLLPGWCTHRQSYPGYQRHYDDRYYYRYGNDRYYRRDYPEYRYRRGYWDNRDRDGSRWQP
jgi:hypothetical protein